MSENPDVEKAITQKVRRLESWIRRDLPREVGMEAVDHFRENFEREGFVNGGLHKWPDVRRRDPSSSWYGFDYKREKRSDHPIKFGKKGKRLKNQRKLNFSEAATQRKILNGPSHELQDSLRYIPTSGGVNIVSDKPYAAIQNNGGLIKVFGKKTVTLPARPFVGDSKELSDKIDRIIDNKINQILR
ncbi:phage virion morphogenesis protein [Parabacteroides distasonis]|uniref:phage virion morphogenesis protein n=1 Tax=Parabacteroides distasonis TaxID=823 RepID=UPI00321A6111